MTLLISGLVVFLGIHSVRILADGVRTRVIEQFGKGAWMGVYSVLSLLGIVLIVLGYPAAREETGILWDPSAGGRHIAIALMLVAFILFVASNVNRRGYIKSIVRHPAYAAVFVWAMAHLAANGTVADGLLFLSFGAWSVIGYFSCLRRDALAGPNAAAVETSWINDLIAVVAGVLLWLGFMFFAHEWLFGVSPLNL